MKKNIILSSIIIGALALSACNDLDVAPRNIITGSAVFSSESGVDAYLAKCYSNLYVEDFTHDAPRANWCARCLPSAYCGETVERPSYNNGVYTALGNGTLFEFWNYNYVRDVNVLIQKLEASKNNFSSEKINQWMGEAYFLRANHYFNMAKRYGGLPLTDKVLDMNMPIEEMQIPRSTEYETYKFIVNDFKKAAELLLENTGYTKARACKAAAYGMLSRAALYAGTIAKYNDKYVGYDAIAQLQGIDASHADEFLKEAFEAAKQVTGYSLENDYYNMFGVTKGYDNNEFIMIKEWKHISGEDCHTFVSCSAPAFCRIENGYGALAYNNPTFDLVQMYEDIDGGNYGFDNRIKDASGNYIEYADPADFFKGKDPRLSATIILPFTQYYGVDVIIRKGLIMKDGTILETYNEETLKKALSDGYKINSFPGYNEKYTVSQVYDPATGVATSQAATYGYGVASFDGVGATMHTASGFYVRKFADESVPITNLTQRVNECPFPIIRYAEVLLNLAEAGVELGGNYRAEGLAAMNQVRTRNGYGIAAITDDEFTVERVRHERQVELALEQHTYWDKKRWRVMHEEWVNRNMKALCPYLDYTKQVYIFKEGIARPDLTWTYDNKWYYNRIPTTEINKNPKLVQNYGY